MDTSFPLFPSLPPEIRTSIWHFAAHPRHVYLRVFKSQAHGGPAVCLPAPQAPAVVHACREARHHGPYTKAFLRPPVDKDVLVPAKRPGRAGPGYVWVNFEMDMICIPHRCWWWLEPHQAEIRRLRFVAGSSFPYEQSMFMTDDDARARRLQLHQAPRQWFGHFSAVREVDVWVTGHFPTLVRDFCRYGGVEERILKKMRFIDTIRGLVFTKEQFEMAMRWEDGRGGLIVHQSALQGLDEWVVDEILRSVMNFPLSEMSEVE